jgi:thiol:disulfide interchange protein/DsbC/DsbD-like thiol-disulfide interchange protein
MTNDLGMMKCVRILGTLLGLLPGLVPASAQELDGRMLVEASLVADTTAVVPGQPFQVGLLLKMAPGWHTYWEYPGDAGLPTMIAWDLPMGFGTGPIQWPLPHRVLEPGDIEAYAYKDEVLLTTTIVPPENLTDKTITLRAISEWLVCEEICVPGSAELTLDLSVAATAVSANEELFRKFRDQIPSAEPPPYALTWRRDGGQLTLKVEGLEGVGEVDVFPLPVEGQLVNHPMGGVVTDGVTTVTLETSGDLRGVLVVETAAGRRGWFVSSGEAIAASDNPPSAATDRATPDRPGFQIRSPQSQTSLAMALFYGFLGGLILNLMPCVLPVISLKIFGFIRQAGEKPGKIFRHGLAFVAGIFLWFLGLGVIVVALKAAGSEVTWAFQFQNPWFNLVIASIVFVFALNLFGVFEIVLPGRTNTALDGVSSGDGYAGSFAQGLFATLLATPCTAPFLGTALGFAFSQSAMVILVMFAAVAFGMGLPYLLLSARPGWMKMLPKPGAWMERMKQFMGFPLLATLLWLLYVLGNQKGLEGVIWAGSFLLCLALACWIYGAFCGPLSSGKTRIVSIVLIFLIVGWGGKYFLAGKFAASQRVESVGNDAGGIAWQPFSEKALAALLAEGKPVFLDFTADWCISCKYNERIAINVPAVRELIAAKGIVPVKADWTNANPEITAALKKFGRVGVPFYVIYPAGRPEDPITLPEILTENIVLDGLRRATQ